MSGSELSPPGKKTKLELAVRILLAQKRLQVHFEQKGTGETGHRSAKVQSNYFSSRMLPAQASRCSDANTPDSRTEFWQNKFDMKVARDHKNTAAFRYPG